MGKVFEIFSGKKLTEKDIDMIAIKKTEVDPIDPEEIERIAEKAEKMAHEGMMSLEKSGEELKEKTLKNPGK